MSNKYSKDSLFLSVSLLTLLLLLASFACTTAPMVATPAALPAAPPMPMKQEIKQPATHVSSISETELENIEYLALSAHKGAVKLHRGVFRKYASTKSKTETMTALSHYIAYGTLPGKREGAAAVLITMTGGTITHNDLAIVTKTEGRLKNIATTSLGDRIQIKALSIENGSIIVNMLVHKKKDPACCPTQEVIRRYELQGNKLVLVKDRQK
jgi:hypothetical protein